MGTSALEFEKPLAELEKQIEEVRRVAEEQKLDVSQQMPRCKRNSA
jgi:acetyl-CoA carboxylase alpha subunit